MDYDPLIKSQLASRNQFQVQIWCRFDHITVGLSNEKKPPNPPSVTLPPDTALCHPLPPPRHHPDLATSLPHYLSISLPLYLTTSLPLHLSTSLPLYLSTSLCLYLSTYVSLYISISRYSLPCYLTTGDQPHLPPTTRWTRTLSSKVNLLARDQLWGFISCKIGHDNCDNCAGSKTLSLKVNLLPHNHLWGLISCKIAQNWSR